ncbi:MAG: GxxExxY protein [Chthoniobacterales bacterium]
MLLFRMDDQTYQIIGAALEVHKELGCGFLEPVYQEALELELTDRRIPFYPQAAMPVFYKGRELRSSYRADVLCYDSIIVELKALGKLGDVETAQVLNYLKAGRHQRGLVFNFGATSLQHQRFVWSHDATP